MKHILWYFAMGGICLLVGIRLGVSAHPYKDVVCEDAADGDLAMQLANWSPMHRMERSDITHSISDEYPTLWCRAYMFGMPIEFYANQRWIKRSDPNIKFKRKR